MTSDGLAVDDDNAVEEEAAAVEEPPIFSLSTQVYLVFALRLSLH